MTVHNPVVRQNENWSIHRPEGQLDLAELLVPKESGDEKEALGSIQSILDAVRTHLKMDVGFVSEFKNGRRHFRYVSCPYDNPPIGPGGSDPLEESYCQRVVDGRFPELMQDAGSIPAAAELPVTSELPVGAHLSVPLILSDGKVFGTFCCFSYGSDFTLNERDLGLLRVFAQLAAGIIEQRAQKSIRREALRAVSVHSGS